MVSSCSPKKKNDEFVRSDLNTNPCQLVPGQKPLAKHKFYFDLKNRLLANKLETQIKELGGNVELFLVKEVTHLITDRETWYKNNRPITPQSPLNDSFTNDATGANSSRNSRPKSRADAMLQRARCKPAVVVNDPLEEARKWGITIWPVEKTLSWLDGLAIKALSQKKSVKVFELKAPYIKFEAFDRKTRPVFKEVRDWPRLNLQGVAGDPAFICRSQVERNMTRKTRVNYQRNDTLQPGYCEVCRVEYSQLGKHLKSDTHQKFINDNANFITLDSLIENGAGIDSFLKLHVVEDKMCDSDADYCPPLTRNKMPASRVNHCDKEKPKSLPLSPIGVEAGGHRLRSRGHVNYVISTPTEDEYPFKQEEVKESRELRSSARLCKANAHPPEPESDTWESGRPKRACINKKRVSSDDHVLLDRRTFYKVEVMLNKLRSSNLSENKHENAKKPPQTEQMVDDKGLIVKFRKIRNSELTYLNNEAENFLFPKKDDSSDEDPDADGPNTTVSTGKNDSTLLLSSENDKKTEPVSETSRRNKRLDSQTKIKSEDEQTSDGYSATGSRKRNQEWRGNKRIKREEEEEECAENGAMRKKSRVDGRLGKFKVEDEGSLDSNYSESSMSKKKKRRTHAEAFIMDNQKYYKFETPGSRLRYQGSFLAPVPSKTSPPKSNGECTINEIDDQDMDPVDDVKIKLDELEFAFERVPKEEPWYEAFKRQDKGEMYYHPIGDEGTTKQFLLPYQMGPIPPLDPKICISAYRLKKKILESSTASTSNASDSTVPSSDPSANDEDSKTSVATTDTIDIQSELLKIIEEQNRPKTKRRRNVAVSGGKNPRKSPRQHASTLAILSSLVHHRRRRNANKSRPSDLDESRKGLPVIPEEEREPEPDYEEIERMLGEGEEDGEIGEVDVCQDAENIFCKPDAIEALEIYEEVKNKTGFQKLPKRTLNGSAVRKPGRKKKKNRTGWPNKNRRRDFRTSNKDSNSTKDEYDDRSVDSLSVNSDNDDAPTTDVNTVTAESLGISKLANGLDAAALSRDPNSHAPISDSNAARRNSRMLSPEANAARRNSRVVSPEANTARRNSRVMSPEANAARRNSRVMSPEVNTARRNSRVLCPETSAARRNSHALSPESNALGREVGAQNRRDSARKCSTNDANEKCDDMDRWANDRALAAKLNSDDAQFQPIVRVQKLEGAAMTSPRLRSGSSPRRGDVRRQRRTPNSPKSPRALRKPRGRWYRER